MEHRKRQTVVDIYFLFIVENNMKDIHIINAIIRMHEAITAKVSQWAYGQELNFIGIDLPDGFEAHFCNEGDSVTKTAIGSNNRVRVLDEYLETGKNIKCYIFLHDAETDGRTVYTITIPIVKRPKPSDLEPTPVQHDAITEAIGVLNRAVAQTAQDVESADASAESARADAESAQASATTAVESAQSAQASATSASASADSASQSATSASQSASSASASASSAERDADRAEMVARGSGYFDVEIVGGRLIYTRTDNVDVDFAIVNGHLVMEA